MVRIFGTDEQVQIDEAAFGGSDIQPDFHIRENQRGVGEASIVAVTKDCLIGIRDIIVGDGDRFDGRCGLFESGQIIIPRIGSAELVIHDRPRGMNMWFPSTPFRASVQHSSPGFKILLG